MNGKAGIVALIAVFIGLGGGAAALSRVRAQQTPAGIQLEHAPDDAETGHGTADPHEQEHEEPGHHEGDQDDHDEHGHEDAHDDGHDDDHAEHGAHDDHGEESAVQLSFDERNRFGIKVATAGSGQLATRIRLPGEIVLNADRVAHIVPRAPGIVGEVLKNVGDTVRTGEVMAWLESAELGEAKVDYLAKWAELDCCTVDLTRAQEVHDNTILLLEVLDSSPSLETLRETNGNSMGENRSILVSAYAEFVFAKAAYMREKPLFEKKVASERDYQAAEAEYRKAEAIYAATRDSVGFKIQRDLLEAKRAQRVREIEAKGAKRRLYILGLACEEIAELEAFAQPQTGPATHEAECKDPNCKDCKKAEADVSGRTGPATQEAGCSDPNCKDCKKAEAGIGGKAGANTHEIEESLARYPLRAPFDGTVIDKHLTLGEKHGDDSGAFTIADLSSVWVDIAVYQKDLGYVREGMNVEVSAGAGMPHAQGTISYVAPVMDEETRTALARVVLPNPDGELRPGLFVSAELSVGQESTAVVIPKSAVQRIDEETVVFLDTDEGFASTVVSLGQSNDSMVEVLSGLAAGQRYVTDGAFELKAKITTSGLDAHAGHGH